jgi:hypothetical protein
MTESLKYEAKYLLTNRETADSLIYRLSFMIRDIEAESKKAGVVVDWPNILIETEDWSIDDSTPVSGTPAWRIAATGRRCERTSAMTVDTRM